MKNVRMLLTATAVLAVVGGALAFKAHNYGTLFIFQKPSPEANVCNFIPGLQVGTSETFTDAYSTDIFPGTTTVDPTLCTSTVTADPE